jgi:hypothetical protein
LFLKIGDEEFDKLFFLVDGIYPRYVRFVKSYRVPITAEQKRFLLGKKLSERILKEPLVF